MYTHIHSHFFRGSLFFKRYTLQLELAPKKESIFFFCSLVYGWLNMVKIETAKFHLQFLNKMAVHPRMLWDILWCNVEVNSFEIIISLQHIHNSQLPTAVALCIMVSGIMYIRYITDMHVSVCFCHLMFFFLEAR